uniref:Uncharacterized protein n=1 Tax=Leersia perrieri TaxID=77586 RepID=A0A0D9VAC2_9ORYZ
MRVAANRVSQAQVGVAAGPCGCAIAAPVGTLMAVAPVLIRSGEDRFRRHGHPPQVLLDGQDQFHAEEECADVKKMRCFIRSYTFQNSPI